MAESIDTELLRLRDAQIDPGSSHNAPSPLESHDLYPSAGDRITG
jgi:hypothetical protein